MSKARSIFHLSGRKIAVDTPNLLFATGVAGWAAWYCWAAWHASATTENLILILPVSAAAVVLYFVVVTGCFEHVDQSEEQPTSSPEPLARGTAVKIAGSMVLFVALVFAGPLIGFDVSSFVYVLVMMALLGERRILVLLIVPLLFSVAMVYCFRNLLSTPLPVFFLRGS
jgi:Tripartite tricarboxylate transporter TctB family